MGKYAFEASTEDKHIRYHSISYHIQFLHRRQFFVRLLLDYSIRICGIDFQSNDWRWNFADNSFALWRQTCFELFQDICRTMDEMAYESVDTKREEASLWDVFDIYSKLNEGSIQGWMRVSVEVFQYFFHFIVVGFLFTQFAYVPLESAIKKGEILFSQLVSKGSAISEKGRERVRQSKPWDRVRTNETVTSRWLKTAVIIKSEKPNRMPFFFHLNRYKIRECLRVMLPFIVYTIFRGFDSDYTLTRVNLIAKGQRAIIQHICWFSVIFFPSNNGSNGFAIFRDSDVTSC